MPGGAASGLECPFYMDGFMADMPQILMVYVQLAARRGAHKRGGGQGQPIRRRPIWMHAMRIHRRREATARRDVQVQTAPYGARHGKPTRV